MRRITGYNGVQIDNLRGTKLFRTPFAVAFDPGASQDLFHGAQAIVGSAFVDLVPGVFGIPFVTNGSGTVEGVGVLDFIPLQEQLISFRFADSTDVSTWSFVWRRRIRLGRSTGRVHGPWALGRVW